MRNHIATSPRAAGSRLGRASGLALVLAGSFALAACGSDDDATTPADEGPSRVDIAPSDDTESSGTGDDATGSESSSGASEDDSSSASGDDAASDDASGGSSSGIPLPDPNDVDLATTTFDVTWQDAVATAQERFDGEVTSVTLDHDRRAGGDYVYEIEMESATAEYEVDIHATTGEVVHEEEDGDSDGDTDDILDLDAVTVDVADAMQTALAERPGAIVEWTLDTDDDVQVFTFDMVSETGDDDVDISVDAATSEIVEIDD